MKLRGADAFVIEYVHADPEKAALVPNRLASFLVAEAAEERARRSAADPRLLEARLVEARKAMEEKAAVIRRLREGGASIVPAAPDPEPGRRERLEAEKRAVALDLSAAMARAEGLRLAIAAEERPSTSARAARRRSWRGFRRNGPSCASATRKSTPTWRRSIDGSADWRRRLRRPRLPRPGSRRRRCGPSSTGSKRRSRP